MKKMVNKRLVWYFKTSKLLPNDKCSFRKNHSTLDHLSYLHTDICRTINKNQHLILVALNLEKGVAQQSAPNH